MTDLEKMTEWIKTYKGYDILSRFAIDYADNISPNSGLFPRGITQVAKHTDVLGNTTVTNQTNFALYCTFYSPEEDTAQSEVNAGWVYDFQQWAQEQSITGKAPVFGNTDTETEEIRAENGALYSLRDGTAVYVVQISATYKKEFVKETI